jgi:hypothetical protein
LYAGWRWSLLLPGGCFPAFSFDRETLYDWRAARLVMAMVLFPYLVLIIPRSVLPLPC